MDWQDTALIAVTVLSGVVTIILLMKFAKQILRFFLVLLTLALAIALLLVVVQTLDLWPTTSWRTALLEVLQ
jgi:uncharacterized membrane protein